MTRTEIPHSQWGTFCEQFTRNHRGWRATIALIDTQMLELAAEARAHPLTRELPFHGMSAESEENDGAMLISVGDGPHHLTHTVHGGRRLFVEQDEAGADIGVRIDSDSGQTTVMRFRAAAHPEALDGLAPEER